LYSCLGLFFRVGCTNLHLPADVHFEDVAPKPKVRRFACQC
jgi:hypothetical protein